MSVQVRIKKAFHGKAFERPLFYCYEHGLRFGLSEGGHFLHQFLTGHRKGHEICEAVFEQSEKIHLCVRIYARSLCTVLSGFRALKVAGVFPNVPKTYWCEQDMESEEGDLSDDGMFHHIVYEIEPSYLTNALWCALSVDFGLIEPNPGFLIYLFDLEREIVAFPYDDRGMDVVANDAHFLQQIYHRFNHYLLDYDRKVMDERFGGESLFSGQ